MGNSSSSTNGELVKSLQQEFPTVSTSLIANVVAEYSKPQYARETHNVVEFPRRGLPLFASIIALVLHDASLEQQREVDRHEEQLQPSLKKARALRRVRVKLQEVAATQILDMNTRMTAVCDLLPLCPREAVRKELTCNEKNTPLDWVAETLFIKLCPALLDASRDHDVLVAHHQRTTSWWQRLFTPANRSRILPLPAEHRFRPLQRCELFRDKEYVMQVEQLLQAQFASRGSIQGAMSEHNSDYEKCAEFLTRSGAARKTDFNLATFVKSGKLTNPDLVEEIALLESRNGASSSLQEKECQCCFTDCAEVVQCDAEEGHALCRRCIEAFIDNSATQLATGVVKCFSSDGCQGILRRRDLANMLSERSLNAIDAAVTQANLPLATQQQLGMTLCPFCGGQTQPVIGEQVDLARLGLGVCVLAACLRLEACSWPGMLLTAAVYAHSLSSTQRGRSLLMQREETNVQQVAAEAAVLGLCCLLWRVLCVSWSGFLAGCVRVLLQGELSHLGCSLLADARPAAAVRHSSWTRCVRPRAEGGCGMMSCRKCRETAHDAAQCYSLVPAVDSHESLRKYLQETLTAASVRGCPRCGVEIQKSEGCNKVTCALCGCKMCYECGRDIEGYEHFCQHLTVPGQACAQCSRCHLFKTSFGASEARKTEALHEALRLYRARFPASAAAAPGRVLDLSGHHLRL